MLSPPIFADIVYVFLSNRKKKRSCFLNNESESKGALTTIEFRCPRPPCSSLPPPPRHPRPPLFHLLPCLSSWCYNLLTICTLITHTSGFLFLILRDPFCSPCPLFFMWHAKISSFAFRQQGSRRGREGGSVQFSVVCSRFSLLLFSNRQLCAVLEC